MSFHWQTRTPRSRRAAQIAQLQQYERDRSQKEIEERARKFRELNEISTRKRKRKLTSEEAEEEAAQFRKKFRNYVIIGIAVLFLGYLSFPFIFPPSRNPYMHYTAEKLVAEYAKDQNRADEKFASKVIVVRGKISVEPGATPDDSPRYFFSQGGGELRIEIKPGEMNRVNFKEGREYHIVGKVRPFKGGKVIVLSDASKIVM